MPKIDISKAVVRTIAAYPGGLHQGTEGRTKIMLGDVCGLVLPNSFGSALSFWMAGVPSAGLATDGRGMLLRWPVKDPGPCHEVERFYAAARGALLALGSGAETAVPADLGLPIGAEQAVAAQSALRDQGVSGNYALIAPVATGRHHGRAKHWEHFAELAPALHARGLQAIAAPPVQEVEAVRAALRSATLLRPVPLGVYAALAQRAAIVIANDSGSSHVAAAVGARQVTIFGVTDRKRTGPWSRLAVCVGDNGAWPDVAQVLDAIDQALALP
jgi:heptosyltransferase-2